MKSNSVSNLALAAAFAGLLGGTTARLNAQPLPGSSNTTAAASSHAGILLVAQDGQKQLPKHSCKGKGDCATDGSKSSKG